MSAEPYNHGRIAYRTGGCLPPQEYNSDEKMQWDAGWRDEHLRNPSPFHISALRNVATAIRNGCNPSLDDADILEQIALELQTRRH